MISFIEITSIFIQIFVTGICLSGVYSFALRYFQTKKKENIYLTIILFSFAIFTALTVISEIFRGLGWGWSRGLVIFYKTLSINQVAGAIFIAYFIKEKFLNKENFLFKAFILSCLVEIFLIIRSTLTPSWNEYAVAIEPGLQYSHAIPSELFWGALWMIMGIQYLISARSTKELGMKNVNNLVGASSILVIISFLLTISYAIFTEPYIILIAWVLYLLAAMGFFVGNIIEPESDVAKYPLLYFRTKILYKLLTIFIFVIAFLLIITTNMTVSLNQKSMEGALTKNFLNIAKSAADKIEYLSSSKGVLDKYFIQNIVDSQTKEKKYMYVVSSDGKILVPPSSDKGATGMDLLSPGKDVDPRSILAVRNVLSTNEKSNEGSETYRSRFFDFEDRNVLAAYAPIKKYRLGIIIEQPQWVVYSEIRALTAKTMIIIIVGIILAVLVGIFVSKSIEKSIKDVTAGTEAVAKGDLLYKIKISSMDEIGQLATAFNKMTEQLKKDQDSLIASEKLASLGTMAAGMAHEIKNPLVSLRTFTQLLPQRYEDEEFRKKFAMVVPQEIDKINKIAESLLRFGRPHKPELTEVNVNEILEEILALFDNEARKNNVRVTTKLAELPKITADAGQLSQAFVNIILNGIQSMQGGGELTVKTDVGEIVKLGQGLKEGEEESSQRPSIFIEISDTGVGIPEENKTKIFDPFFTTKEVGGTGMGMPITRRIIEDHHGSIRLTSKIGKGTTFFVTLPVSPENYKA